MKLKKINIFPVNRVEGDLEVRIEIENNTSSPMDISGNWCMHSDLWQHLMVGVSDAGFNAGCDEHSRDDDPCAPALPVHDHHRRPPFPPP